MSFNKIISAIALSLSFHNAIICMENEAIGQFNITGDNEEIIFENGQMTIRMKNAAFDPNLNEINKQVTLIDTFTKDIIGHNPTNIKPLGDWLMQKRNIIHDKTEWNLLVTNLINAINSSKNKFQWQKSCKQAISTVIEEIARNLLPKQDYSLMLAEHATEAVTKAIQQNIKK